MLQALVDRYTRGNKAQFATMLGLQAQTISAWFARGTFNTELIYAKCEGVSADWLLTGVGDMIKPISVPEKHDQQVGTTHVDELTRIIQTQAATLLEQQRFINDHFRQEGIERVSPPHEYTEYPDNKDDGR